MKKISLAILLSSIFPITSYSQQIDTALQRQSYVFEDFVNGKVRLKSGEIDAAQLNYCAYDQTILFKENQQTMVLTGMERVDSIFISDKKFVPLKNAVYEVINSTGKVQLYASYTSKLHPWQATSDNNGSTRKNNNEVSNTISNAYVSRPYKGDFSIEIIKRYWLRSFNKLYKVYNVKDFTKVFKEDTNPSITEYVHENKIDFGNEADLIKLVNFCNKQ